MTYLSNSEIDFLHNVGLSLNEIYDDTGKLSFISSLVIIFTGISVANIFFKEYIKIKKKVS